MGGGFWEQGMYPEAEKFAMESLKMRVNCLPTKHFHIALCKPGAQQSHNCKN